MLFRSNTNWFQWDPRLATNIGQPTTAVEWFAVMDIWKRMWLNGGVDSDLFFDSVFSVDYSHELFTNMF